MSLLYSTASSQNGQVPVEDVSGSGMDGRDASNKILVHQGLKDFTTYFVDQYKKQNSKFPTTSMLTLAAGEVLTKYAVEAYGLVEE